MKNPVRGNLTDETAIFFRVSGSRVMGGLKFRDFLDKFQNISHRYVNRCMGHLAALNSLRQGLVSPRAGTGHL